MKRFVEGEDRSQSILFPERLDDYIEEDNPVRVIDVFVDALDLEAVRHTLKRIAPTKANGLKAQGNGVMQLRMDLRRRP